MIENQDIEAPTGDEAVRCVVDYLIELGKQHDLQQDEDSILGAVEQASNLLSVDLDEKQTEQACDLVLVEQSEGDMVAESQRV